MAPRVWNVLTISGENSWRAFYLIYSPVLQTELHSSHFTSQCSNSLRTKHKAFISHYDEPRPVWDFKIGFRHCVLFMLCHDLCTSTITKVKLYFPTWWVRRYFHSAASALSRRSKGLHYRQLWPQRSGGWGGHRPGVTHIINGQGSPVSRVKARHGWPGQYTLVIRL